MSAPPAAAGAGDKFLLSAQVLLDLCGTNNNPARQWAQPISTLRLRLSVLTVAFTRATVAQQPEASQRSRLSARLEELLNQLKADGGEPLPFEERAAAMWQSFMYEPSLGEMTQIDRQFYAVAVHEGLYVVEYQHVHSATLASLGVRVQTLGPSP